MSEPTPKKRRRVSAAAAAHRLALVATHAAKGLTTREIVAKLEAAGETNPRTNRAWGLNSIVRDVERLEREWRARAKAQSDEHRACILAGLREVERAAWDAMDLNVVLRSLKQQCELLGLDEPQRVDITYQIAKLAEELGMPEAEAQRIVSTIIGVIDGRAG